MRSLGLTVVALFTTLFASQVSARGPGQTARENVVARLYARSHNIRLRTRASVTPCPPDCESKPTSEDRLQCADKTLTLARRFFYSPTATRLDDACCANSQLYNEGCYGTGDPTCCTGGTVYYNINGVNHYDCW